jgi:hypothetical protein
MSWYLVEAYAPASQELGDIDARINMSVATAPGVTHLTSILIPEDETCFHIFEAESRDVVLGVSDAAGLSPLRIVETRHLEWLG